MFPIYVINLQGSDQRLLRAAQQLAGQSLPFTRIDAVNGKALDASTKRALIDRHANRHHFYRPLSDGEIGCYLSHQKCWQALLDSNQDYALILEDDFRAVGCIKSAMAAATANMQQVDIVKMSNYQGRERPIKYRQQISKEHDLVIHNKPLSGCCAYVISRRGAKRMLSHSHKLYRPVDTDMQHSWQTTATVAAIQPYPVIQDNAFDSDIGNKGRNKPAPYPLQKQWLALRYWLPCYLARKQLIKHLKAGEDHHVGAPVTHA